MHLSVYGAAGSAVHAAASLTEEEGVASDLVAGGF